MQRLLELIGFAGPTGDPIQKIAGSFGLYQLWICFLIFLNKFPMAWHQMAIIFLAPKHPFKCKDKNDALNACPCKNPDFDTSIFQTTIISQWKLICDDKWLASLTQTMFQFGTLCGSIIFGMISDRFGRKWPLIAAVIIQASCGISSAYCPSFWLFTLLRFLIGASVGGTMVVGFVVIMEFVGAKYRDVISALYQVPFNMGHVSLALFGYVSRDYQKFQLIISVPTLLLLSYICFIPETPRWLLAMKRTEQAITILTHVAKINKRPTATIRYDIIAYQASLAQHSLKKGHIFDLFRTPNIRKNMLAMAFNWLTCSYCFYGLSQYVGQLSGDVFLNVACSASTALLGTLASIPLMRFLGRRTIVIISHFVCAVCLFILAVLPEGVLSVVCACIGVVTAFLVFVVVYLYCSELFPTVVRNAAMGFASMCARIGSMIAPFVVDLKDFADWLPPVVFGICPLLAGFITFLLPETRGCELTTTIEEGEQFGKKSKAPKK